ncbi:MAG: hypothetical protein HZY74_06035 [Brevundimonas sp.]|nr:MAG: hypothetical protein HZY74_06035 [Brevundimonas sp.]
MRLPLITVLLTTAALATACERPAAPAEAPATEAAPAKTDATAAPAFALDPEGLRIVNTETGASRLIAFGTPAPRCSRPWPPPARVRHPRMAAMTNARRGHRLSTMAGPDPVLPGRSVRRLGR